MAEPLQGLTVEAARRQVSARLRSSGTDSPDLDARLLIGAALDLDLTGLVREGQRLLTATEDAAINTLIARRLRGEPVARILGQKEFWGLTLALNDDTLVPRPDTETIIEAVLDYFRATGEHRAPLRIADIGTGSGAILLALLTELPNAIGVATDISLNALGRARDNANACGLGRRCLFVNTSYTDALAPGFDLVVSNPPYIPSADIKTLDVDVREFDPLRALDGGADGLDAYRTITPAAASLLKPGGLLAYEIGFDQSEPVLDLMIAAGLEPIGDARHDLGGNPRVVMARTKAKVQQD